MPRSAAANREIRAATRQVIISSALTLFAENGYAHTSIRKIADHAGVATGLMYHYFSGKEALLVAVFEHCMALLSRPLQGIYVNYFPPHRLPALLDALLTELVQKRDVWTLFYALRAQPAIDPILGDHFRVWTTRLRDLFSADLLFAGRSDPEFDAYMLYSLLEGTIQQYLLDPKRYPLEKMKEAIKRFTIDD